jgi:hypothetical protein
MVDDLDVQVAALNARGIETQPIETAPGLFMKTDIVDPEGNLISFGQSLSA